MLAQTRHTTHVLEVVRCNRALIRLRPASVFTTAVRRLLGRGWPVGSAVNGEEEEPQGSLVVAAYRARAVAVVKVAQ